MNPSWLTIKFSPRFGSRRKERSTPSVTEVDDSIIWGDIDHDEYGTDMRRKKSLRPCGEGIRCAVRLLPLRLFAGPGYMSHVGLPKHAHILHPVILLGSACSVVAFFKSFKKDRVGRVST